MAGIALVFSPGSGLSQALKAVKLSSEEQKARV